MWSVAVLLYGNILCSFLGIIWQKDPNVILSCSKDKTLFHHIISDAERPAEKAPPVALSLSPSGVVGHAFPNKILKLTVPKQR